MIGEPISLEAVIRKRDELFSGDTPIGESFRIFMRWLGEHEASLSEEANQYFNTVLNNLFTTAE